MIDVFKRSKRVLQFCFIVLFIVLTGVTVDGVEPYVDNSFNVSVTDDELSFQDLSGNVDIDKSDKRELAIRWSSSDPNVAIALIYVQINFEGEYELLCRIDAPLENVFVWKYGDSVLTESFRNGPRFYKFYQFKVVLKGSEDGAPLAEAMNAEPVYYGHDINEVKNVLSSEEERSFYGYPVNSVQRLTPRTPEVISSPSHITGHFGGLATFFQYFKGCYYVVRGGVLNIYNQNPAEGAKPVFVKAYGREITDFKIRDPYLYLTARQYPGGSKSYVLSEEGGVHTVLEIAHDYEPTVIEGAQNKVLIGGLSPYATDTVAIVSPPTIRYDGIVNVYSLDSPNPAQPVETKYFIKQVVGIKEENGYVWVGTYGNTSLFQWGDSGKLNRVQHISSTGITNILEKQDIFYLSSPYYGPDMISRAVPAAPDVIKRAPFVGIDTILGDRDGLLMGINSHYANPSQPQIARINYDLNPQSIERIAGFNDGWLYDLSLSPEEYCVALGNRGVYTLGRERVGERIDLSGSHEALGACSFLLRRSSGECSIFEMNTSESDRIESEDAIWRTHIFEGRLNENLSNEGVRYRTSIEDFRLINIVPFGDDEYLAAFQLETHGKRNDRYWGETGSFMRIDRLDRDWQTIERFYLENEEMSLHQTTHFDMDGERIVLMGANDRYNTTVYTFNIERNDLGDIQFIPVAMKIPVEPINLRLTENGFVTTYLYGSDSVVTFWDVDFETFHIEIEKQFALRGGCDRLFVDEDGSFAVVRWELNGASYIDYYEMGEDGNPNSIDSIAINGSLLKTRYENGTIVAIMGNQVWRIPKHDSVKVWQLPSLVSESVFVGDDLLAGAYPSGWYVVSDEPGAPSGEIAHIEDPAVEESPAIWRRVAAVMDRTVSNDQKPVVGSRILCDPSGELIVLNSESGVIHQLDGEGVLSELFNPPIYSSIVQPLSYPMNFCLSDGRLIVADTNHHTIRALDLETLTVQVIAGTQQSTFNGDGLNSLETNLDAPTAVCALEDGTVIFAEGAGRRIRAILPDGTVRRIAGAGSEAEKNPGFKSYYGAVVNSLQVDIGTPMDLAVYKNTLYFTSLEHSLIGAIDLDMRMADGSYNLRVVLGGQYGDESEIANGRLGRALRFPQGMSVTPDGRLFVCDTGNYRILEWNIHTNAVRSYGGNGSGSYGDGFPEIALHARPVDVCSDENGVIYFSDEESGTIRKITADPVFRADLDDVEKTGVRFWRLMDL